MNNEQETRIKNQEARTWKQFAFHSLLFTLRLPFSFYHGKQKTDHGKRLENRKQKTVKAMAGFTIVELTIATAVFATVLLVGLVSFLGVGKVYYKSVSLTQTQAVAQQIVSQLTADIQFAPTIFTGGSTSGSVAPPGNDQVGISVRYEIGPSYSFPTLSVSATESNGAPVNGGSPVFQKSYSEFCDGSTESGGTCTLSQTHTISLAQYGVPNASVLLPNGQISMSFGSTCNDNSYIRCSNQIVHLYIDSVTVSGTSVDPATAYNNPPAGCSGQPSTPLLTCGGGTASWISAGNESGIRFICLGNVRYTYNLYNQVNLADHDLVAKFGLLRDVLPGASGCASPFGDNSVPLKNPQELLGNKMRLSKFNLSPAKNAAGGSVTDLWDVAVIVAYGDDDVLTNPGSESVSCDANLSSSQFCSVSKQNTTVSRGL